MDAGSIGLLREAILADPFSFALLMPFALVSCKVRSLTPIPLCPSSIILVYNLLKRLLHQTHTYNGPSALELSSAVLRLA